MPNNPEEEKLAQAGFEPTEIWMLRSIKQHVDNQRQHDQTVENNRLEFLRWLYQHGQLTEGETDG